MLSVTATSFALMFIASTAYADSVILNSYPQYAPLPTVVQAPINVEGVEIFTNTTQTSDGALDLNLIQGDVLVGMRKDKELFAFFHINNPTSFKDKMQTSLTPLITSTAQLISPQFDSPFAVNLAFSATGLSALGVTDDPGDSSFSLGQFADAAALGDQTDAWVTAFKGTNINGVFLIASTNWAEVDNARTKVTGILGSDVTFVHELRGEARTGTEAGHEHFGYMDGIAQPAVKGFTTNPLPGQAVLDPGLFLLGEEGDDLNRPTWAKGGSLMAFRQLQQLVPEFNAFVADQAAENGISPDLLGARMVGRWKSGAPVDLAPTEDDPALAVDPARNNNFNFSHPDSNIRTDQSRCPFSAHIRKTAPRADFNPQNTANHIIRAGIPYGPEVFAEEAASNTTTHERGLAFVSYQSSITRGFRFMQRSWANDPTFFFGKNDSTPGADPIIGQLSGKPRAVSGLIPGNPTKDINFLEQHVVSRGGEYFFVPSIEAIRTGFAN